jgi:succinate dehydrogenase / fumarate reductase cytochrome b subunit
MIVAATGLFLCLFLIVHLSANALLLLPEDLARELYNSYSTFLRESPLIKVIAYLLYLSIILHVIYSIVVVIMNWQARPVRYAHNKTRENSEWASQNMIWLGILVLIFIAVHLFNFWSRIKLGLGEAVGMDSLGNKDVYEVTYSLFQNIWYVAFYTVLMIPLGYHLHHGLKSGFKTLGFHSRNGLKTLSTVSLIYALVIAIGFGVIPFVVYLK